MASVSYNGQSFVVDGRRTWILGASVHYARIHPTEWPERIAAARQAGFNTIDTACPWIVHEPRRGRYVFQDGADVKRFVQLCAEARMRVILRVGPFIGNGYDGGGLPSWLTEDEAVELREANEAYLRLVSRYFRKLFAEVAPLQATKGGPILLVQVEQDWTCANDAQAERYLRQLGRMVRECGVAVPLINANNLWVDRVGTIDTWGGGEDLLANLRQLRTVQPDAPRLVTLRGRGSRQVWGQPPTPTTPPMLLQELAETLAAGAQPIVSPFHGGTNFGFLGGHLAGPAGGTVTTSAAAGAPLGEAGARGDLYRQVRRVVTFAGAFAHVFADLDPDYHPIALDPGELLDEGKAARPATRSSTRSATACSIAPLRGSGGRVVFVFGSRPGASATLLLDSGVRLPVHLGDQHVGWYVMEVDVHGQGRLDFANLCPHAIVDRSILVMHGPLRTPVFLSINGTPMQATVPSGRKPLVLEDKGLTLVICNEAQIDATFHDDERVYVGVDGFDADGRPRPADGWTRAWSLGRDGELEPLAFAAGAARCTAPRPRSIRLTGWHGAGADAHASGESPRYASLPGAETLPACGAATGYGWYRMSFNVTSTRKRRIHLPLAGDRVHLFIDGVFAGVLGDGPGARPSPVEASLAKGRHVMTALVDNHGRFAEGNDLGRRVGLYGDAFDVKPLPGARPKQVTAKPVDPFQIRAFIAGAAAGQKSSDEQVAWTFTHTRKVPIIVDVDGAGARGTFVLNDKPLAYYAGDSGARRARLLLDPRTVPAMKRGRNVLRFAPDRGQPDARAEIIKATRLYLSVEVLTASAAWAFAKWEPPPATRFAPAPATGPKSRRTPWWWQCRFETPDSPLPAWFDARGLSKGQVRVNGHDAGRYFTATATGRAVGPQTRLYLPRPWLHDDRENDLLVFDEHGLAPHSTRLVLSETGDLD